MTKLPELPVDFLLRRLDPPTDTVSVVIDTDTYNEIDDQFALIYALLSEKLKVESIYAAPFFNKRCNNPRDGMEKSYDEILRLLKLLGISPENFAFHGSTTYLSSREKPIRSDATDDLIKRAMTQRVTPLYVVAIGAISNIASAILLEPRIIERIVLIWLGGHPHYWHTAKEFNLQQDLIAAQLIFDCGVPLVHIPCKNVAEHVRTTVHEIGHYIKDQGIIGDYLYNIFVDHQHGQYSWSKPLWDIITIAYLINPHWVPTVICPSPVLTDNFTWSFDQRRHLIRVAVDAHRDDIFGDLFHKLQQYSKVHT